MLVFARRVEEEIRAGDDLIFKILRVQGDKVIVGIDAPKNVPINREEVYQKILADKKLRVISGNIEIK